MLKKCIVSFSLAFCLTAGVANAQKLEKGIVNNVGTAFQTVTLSQTYTDMVVVCTPVYDNVTTPAVVRVTNATGNSFQVRIQNPGDLQVPQPRPVQYMVVEAGLYTEATDGIKMEAVKMLSTDTAGSGNWGAATTVTYQQSYDNPVVVGQVMTQNDLNWSVFFAKGPDQGDPPTSTVLVVGKSVGEDTNTIRANETLGYIVLEEGFGTMSGVEYRAAVGPEIVGSVTMEPPYTYLILPLASATEGALSVAGRNGGDGGWVNFYGANPFNGPFMDIAFDEDQIANAERNHGSLEEIAHVVFGVISAGIGARTFGVPSYVVGSPIPVTIDLTHLKDAASVTIEETLPPGWMADNISTGGTQLGDVITWNLTGFTADVQLSYEVFPLGGLGRSGTFDGIIQFPGQADIPITGDESIGRQGAALPILFIAETGNNQYGAPGSATVDGMYQAAIGPLGLTVDGQSIPGLGYPIRVIDEDAAEEAVPFTRADGLLMFRSVSCSNPGPDNHNADLLPQVINEGVHFEDDNARELFLCTGGGNRDADPAADVGSLWNITNATHPITSVFTQGTDVQMFHPGVYPFGSAPGPGTWRRTRVLSPATGLATEGSGITFLASNTSDLPTVLPCLVAIDPGATGFVTGFGAGHEPAADRRVALGLHRGAFSSPTVAGVVLTQRCIQWAIGDPVTAGTPPPNAPTGLTTEPLVGLRVPLSWNDNSDNESGFVISRQTNESGPFFDVAQVADNVTQFVDQTVEMNTRYTYRVRAFNPAGDSADSNEVSLTIDIVLRTKGWQLYR